MRLTTLLLFGVAAWWLFGRKPEESAPAVALIPDAAGNYPPVYPLETGSGAYDPTGAAWPGWQTGDVAYTPAGWPGGDVFQLDAAAGQVTAPGIEDIDLAPIEAAEIGYSPGATL